MGIDGATPILHSCYSDYIQSFFDKHPKMLAVELKPIQVEEWAKVRASAKRAKITAMKRALNWAAKSKAFADRILASS